MNVRRNSKGMQLLPSAAPLEVVIIDIFGALLTTNGGNHFPIVKTNRFFEFFKTVFLAKCIDRHGGEGFCEQLGASVWPAKMALIRQSVTIYVQMFSTHIQNSRRDQPVHDAVPSPR